MLNLFGAVKEVLNRWYRAKKRGFGKVPNPSLWIVQGIISNNKIELFFENGLVSDTWGSITD